MSANFTFAGKTVYVAKTGLRLGSKGKVTSPSAMFAKMTKGEARKLRKALRAAGAAKFAAMPRA